MGSEQSVPESRESPIEEDDDFDLDQIQADDDKTPPPTPGPSANPYEKSQTKMRHRTRNKGSAEVHIETESKPSPSLSKQGKPKRSGEKSKNLRTVATHSDHQPATKTDFLQRKGSPETFHIYATASSEISDTESSLKQSLVKVESPEHGLKRKRRDGRKRKIANGRSGRTSMKNGQEAQPAVHNLSESEATGSSIRAIEGSLKKTNSTVKKRDILEIPSTTSENGHYVPEKDEDVKYRKAPLLIISEAQEDEVPMAEQLVDGQKQEVQNFVQDTDPIVTTDLNQDQTAFSQQILSMKDVEMQEAQSVSSEQHSFLPNSVFDPVGNPAPASNMPSSLAKTNHKLKQRSDKLESKRKRGTFSPLPVASMDPVIESERTKSPKSKKRKLMTASKGKLDIPTLEHVSRDMPPLGGWAKARSADSSLKHPVFNPASPGRDLFNNLTNAMTQSASRVGSPVPSFHVAIPKLSEELPLKYADNVNGDHFAASKSRTKRVVTTAKGKSKAEAGVDYLSPNTKKSEPLLVSSDLDTNVQPQYGFATTVARRQNLSTARRKKDVKPSIENTSDESQPSSVDGRLGTSSNSSNDPKNTTELKKAGSEDTSSDDADDEKPYRCRTCNRRFITRQKLQSHMKRPQNHTYLHKCCDCSKEFYSAAALREHQKKRGHDTSTGKPGKNSHMSEIEIRKLRHWRLAFQAHHDLDEVQFNDLMTDSCMRSLDDWPHEYITKRELLDQYCQVLPHRTRRSMLQYRERNFKNLTPSKEWNEDDDDLLESLVDELGTKWVEIGQRMTRTSDAVSQRWRHKLVHRKNRRDGFWTSEEHEALSAAVEKQKRRLGLPMDESSDHRITWGVVSDELGNVRTARQCSNHWAYLQQKSETLRKQRNATVGQCRGRGRRSTKAAASDKYVEDSESDVLEVEATPSKSENEEGKVSKTPKKPREDSFVNSLKPTERIAQIKTTEYMNPNSLDTESRTPQFPRSPLKNHTTGESTSLSPAFGQTQANISSRKDGLKGPDSARKLVTEIADAQQMSDRPSPLIPLRLRSDEMEQEMRDDMVGEGELEANDEEVGSEDFGIYEDENEESSADKSEDELVEERTPGDTDEGVEASEDNGDDEKAQAEESSSADESDDDENGINDVEDEETLGKAESNQKLGSNVQQSDEEETSSEGEDEGSDEEEGDPPHTDREDESGEGSSASGSDDDSGSESESSSGLGSDSKDSMVQDTRKDFLKQDFLTNLVRTKNAVAGRKPVRVKHEVDDDSE